MFFSKEINKNNINQIVAIVKLASLLFCSIMVCNKIFTQNKIKTDFKYGYINFLTIGLFTFTISGIYFLWIFIIEKFSKSNYIKILHIIEYLIFIIIFSVSIILSNAYISQYKFLFIFIIITSTIELDMNYGMLVAFISSIVILIIDLVYAPYTGVNLSFQNDLIIVGIFMLTSWLLGHYVEIENENTKLKNLQLEKLNNELKVQDTKRKYIEDILLKNEACYNILIENSKQAIIVHHNDTLIFVNEGAINLAGFVNQSELIGKSIFSLIPAKEIEIIKEKFNNTNLNEEIFISLQSKVLKNDGTVSEVQITSTYFIYEGKKTILSILYDITPEKQVKKLQMDVVKNIELLNETREFNRLNMELFTNISHELKTPLNVIYAAVQVLNLYNSTDEAFIDKRTKYINIMKQNCYRLTKLITNFLDISKLDSGFLKISLATLNIVSVIEDITLSVAPYVESKNVSLIFDTDIEEKVMSFDPNKIERIMLNLLSNAIKYTDIGGEILVTLTDLGDNVSISVKDTGIGIPKDKLEFIFERFGQVDRTLKRTCEGTGIGLALVKSFVKMHDGTINIKSTIGIGSEFTIILPVKILEDTILENEFTYEPNIERINIEFSDIYSNNL